MKVRLSVSARRYLRSETTYLRQYSPSAVASFIAQIEQARQNLARFPSLGRGIDRLPVPGMHRLVIGNYVIDYQLRDAEIVIMTIRHGRQQPPEEVAQDFDYERERSMGEEQ